MNGQQRNLKARLMVTDEDLKTHIVEGERCQRHPRTLSSPVSYDVGALRA